ncbi:MAG: hypothetical protein JJE13_01250 [Thermoleophilia bacterium]|nr:hypothetical protein [Thermoleophilia bacterium]
MAVLTLSFAACGEEDIGNAPDVRGLQLDVAKKKLQKANYSTSVEDDAMFGVVIESHFTVCSQSSPKGRIIPLEVSKDC